jgi:hypothetical protein
MTTVLKGKSFTQTISFKGASVLLLGPPSWVLSDPNGNIIQSGIASGAGRTWSATFTVPTTMIIPNGEIDADLTFSGETTSGQILETSKVVTLLDVNDNWRSYGLLWYAEMGLLRDVVFYGEVPNMITVKVKDNAGVVIATQVMSPPVPTSTTSEGSMFNIDVTGFAPALASSGLYPYQMVIVANLASTPVPDIVTKPVYVLDGRGLGKLTSLKRYLDKARLTEIDPNLQWQDEELLHFMLEGMQFINAFPPQLAGWTLADLPTPMDSFHFMASAFMALNARYLAEGFTKFEFQGANTQLIHDRTEAIQYKIDELKGLLEAQLPLAKKSAITLFGAGSGITAKKPIGKLGISYSPVTNYSYTGPNRGFRL